MWGLFFMEEDKKISSLAQRNDATELSLAEASSIFPGFRFSPTDEELICFYLKKKIEGLDNCVEVIPEVDICRYEPWDLPGQSILESDNEWVFFSSRGRKYPNGSQSKRATDSGYWKATGKERNVKSGSTVIGTKRTLVFHTGRAPKGQRTEWIMHEYCMSGKLQDLMVVCRLRRNIDFNLDDTSRKKSRDQMHSSEVNKNTTASSGIEQTVTGHGKALGDGSSKECSSSYNSHSVEQMDSGFESDDKIPNELSHQASSSHQKIQESNSNDEDCFADIMKDEIVKLDDSAIYMTPQPTRPVALESDSKKESKQPAQVTASPVPPSQGTASRRIRLRRVRSRPLGAYKVMNAASPRPLPRPSISLLSDLTVAKRLPCLSMFMSLMVLVSVVLAAVVLFVKLGSS